MVFEVGQPSQDSVEFLHAWPCHGSLSRDDKLGIQPVELDPKLSEIPRCTTADPAIEAYLKERGCAPLVTPELVKERHRDKLQFPVQASGGGFAFTAPALSNTALAFNFAKASPWLSPRFKRRRHRLDVDGPNTADLCSKKRRIRSDLTTSPLSQAYSQPATHILNREGMESGDKRFLKMATTVDMAKRIAHLHGTSFLRFSMMNRLRRRLGLWKPRGELPQENGTEAVNDVDIDTKAKAPWRAQSVQAEPGGKCLKPSASGVDSTAVGAGDRHQGTVKPGHNLGKMPPPRLSKPAALPFPSADFRATKKLTSPRIQPVRSPELRPIGHYEELEEDSFAFLHADDESAGDIPDDSEDVYSDFGVIFGVESAAEEDEDHTYEEYLDELDGISWMTR